MKFNKLVLILYIILSCYPIVTSSYRISDQIPHPIRSQIQNLVTSYEIQVIPVGTSTTIIPTRKCNGYRYPDGAIITSAHCVTGLVSRYVISYSIVDNKIMGSEYNRQYYLSNSLPLRDYAYLSNNRHEYIEDTENFISIESGETIYFFDRNMALRKAKVRTPNVKVLLDTGYRIVAHEFDYDTENGDSGSPIFREDGTLIGILCGENKRKNLSYFVSIPIR